MNAIKKVRMIIPGWVWGFTVITLFLCTLSYTESDIYYASELMSFWASWAKNMMAFSYTYELFYVLIIALVFLIKKNIVYNNKATDALPLFRQIAIYSALLIAGVLITNLISYIYASFINNSQITFGNYWAAEEQSTFHTAPLTSGLVMSSLMFLRLTLSGLVVSVMSIFFNKKAYIGFTVVCIGLIFIGFDAVMAFSNINIFPFQYAGSNYQRIIFGEQILGYTPISFGSAIGYFISLIAVALGLMMLACKYKKVPQTIHKTRTNISFKNLMGELVRAKHVWLIIFILVGILPFLYFCDWLPRSGKLDSAFMIFTNAFAYGYLFNFLLPLLSVAVIGFTMWRDVRAMMETNSLTGKKYLHRAIITSVSAGIVVIVATLGAMSISLLTAPNTDWDWEFTVLFMLRLFVISCVFAAIGFGILALTNNEVASMAVPLLYTNYALGGIYHIAGCNNIGIFQKIMPQISTSKVMESISSGYENIISAAIVAIVLLVIGYMKIRKRGDQE